MSHSFFFFGRFWDWQEMDEDSWVSLPKALVAHRKARLGGTPMSSGFICSVISAARRGVDGPLKPREGAKVDSAVPGVSGLVGTLGHVSCVCWS